VIARPPRLSIVVPAFDEQECLGELSRRMACLDGLCRRELIFVDDASSDGTWAEIERLAAADPRVRGIGLAHNQGSQRALLAGLAAARGDAAVTLDADLQHPPERIPDMLRAWLDGAEVVEMERENAPPQGLVRDLLTPGFYALFNAVSPVAISPRSTDFRLLDRACLDQLAAQPQQLVRAMVKQLRRRTVTLAFAVPPRFAGASRYDLPRLARTAVSALTATRSPRYAAPPAVVRTVGEPTLDFALGAHARSA
jgi:dolichol-phosphate mannosyltransferase